MWDVLLIKNANLFLLTSQFAITLMESVALAALIQIAVNSNFYVTRLPGLVFHVPMILIAQLPQIHHFVLRANV